MEKWISRLDFIPILLRRHSPAREPSPRPSPGWRERESDFVRRATGRFADLLAPALVCEGALAPALSRGAGEGVSFFRPATGRFADLIAPALGCEGTLTPALSREREAVFVR